MKSSLFGWTNKYRSWWITDGFMLHLCLYKPKQHVVISYSTTKRSTKHQNFNSLTLLPARLCVYRRIWWISFSFPSSSSFITCFSDRGSLIYLWYEALAGQRIFLFYQNSLRSHIKDEENHRFHAALARKNFWFLCPSRAFLSLSCSYMFLSWVTRSRPFAIHFLLPQLAVAQEAFFLLGSISHSRWTCCSKQAISAATTLDERKKNVISDVSLFAVFAVCLWFWSLKKDNDGKKWMSNDFLTVDRESIDSFDTTFTFNLLNCMECLAMFPLLCSLARSLILISNRLDWFVFDDIILLVS